MRRRQLKALCRRLGQLQQMKLMARELLIKLGEAKGRYRAAWRLRAGVRILVKNTQTHNSA
jgi:hypothetical protein